MGSKSLKGEYFQLFGEKSGGVLYGQHIRLLHRMRTQLIYVSRAVVREASGGEEVDARESESLRTLLRATIAAVTENGKYLIAAYGFEQDVRTTIIFLATSRRHFAQT